MKTQNVLGLLLVVSVIVCTVLIGIILKKDKSNLPAEETSSVIAEAKIDAKVIARSVDEKGYSKAVIERQKEIIGSGDITKLPVSQSVIDSLRLDNLDKSKKLQQASAIYATVKAENLQAHKLIDSLKRTYYLYNDDFTTAKFTPDSTGGKFDINYRISLIRQDYAKRKWFLGPQVNYTEILSPDSRITIDGMKSLQISSQKPTRFGIGLQGGYYYDPEDKKMIPLVGFGISYNLIRF